MMFPSLVSVPTSVCTVPVFTSVTKPVVGDVVCARSATSSVLLAAAPTLASPAVFGSSIVNVTFPVNAPCRWVTSAGADALVSSVGAGSALRVQPASGVAQIATKSDVHTPANPLLIISLRSGRELVHDGEQLVHVYISISSTGDDKCPSRQRGVTVTTDEAMKFCSPVGAGCDSPR